MSKKLTHEDYLQKLLNNNIKVIPLEQYINTRTKILHKCTCNNEWDISPNNILKGTKCLECGVKIVSKSKMKDVRKLIKEAKEKFNNKFSYSNIKTLSEKLTITCPEHGEYENLIVNHLNSENGCRLCNHKKLGKINSIRLKDVDGFHSWNKKVYKNRKTILYYIQVNGIYKIGITVYNKSIEKSIKSRYRGDIKNGVIISIIKTKIYEDGIEAYIAEQTIKEKFSDFRYKAGDMNWFGGYTELFEKDIRNLSITNL